MIEVFLPTILRLTPELLKLFMDAFDKRQQKNAKKGKKTKPYQGSKVVDGRFKNQRVRMFADKACIQMKDPENLWLLTDDNIKTYQLIKKQDRKVGDKEFRYFYYDIVFRDGTRSYIRMRQPYRIAMKEYTSDKKRIPYKGK